MPTALLWHMDGEPAARPSPDVAPPFSWASFNRSIRCIRMGLGDVSWYSIVDSSYIHAIKDPNGRVSFGEVHVKGRQDQPDTQATR
jgi:hypothetical protein